jgi:hypothetical protein
MLLDRRQRAVCAESVHDIFLLWHAGAAKRRKFSAGWKGLTLSTQEKISQKNGWTLSEPISKASPSS